MIHDHAWLPQHINFAKYKLATQQPLLSDGVHATDAVQAGIAAMSYVSRTGRSPSRAGVDANSAKAMELGEHTIRTMATYSRTGIHIPDVPAAPTFVSLRHSVCVGESAAWSAVLRPCDMRS